MIKAILSDGGNILFDDNTDRNFAVDYFHKKTGIERKLIEEDLQRMKEQLRKSYTQAQARGIGPYKVEGEQEEVYLHLHPKLNKKIEKDLTRDAYLLLLHAYGLKNCKEFEELYLKNSTRKRELFPGVRETLENLEGKLDFVVVTDAVKPGIKLYESLPRMGIRKGVKSVVSSVDVGCAKPAPEFFDAVLQRCGYTKEEVAFVGHDYDEAVGAYRYGIPHIVLFNYDKKELERIREQIPPESLHVIPNTEKRDNFSEVSEIVRKINSKSQD